MTDSRQTPPQTAHKAVAATIASLLCTIVMGFLGFTPTTEDLLAEDLRRLVESIAALVIMAVVPGIAAYLKRNKLR